MARIFIGTGQVNYIGTPYQRPIQICNGGKAVPLFFDWLAYNASSNNPTINVKVSLQTPDVKTSLLKQIASVYIDNTNSPIPIYVFCPDTKYTAIAKPNSAGWYPLYTNAFEIWVIAQGFTTGQIPQTMIFVSDLFIPPYTDEEIGQSLNLGLASAQISRGKTIYNTNNAPFALGDQFKQVQAVMQLNGQIFGPIFPIQPGFIYITSMQVYAQGSTNTTSNGESNCIFENVASGIFAQFDVYLPGQIGGPQPNTQPYVAQQIYSTSNVQWKLDATTQWQLRIQCPNIGSLQGTFTWCFTFTTNPQ